MYDYTTTNSNLLSLEECRSIIDIGLDLGFVAGTNLSRNDTPFYDPNQRKCKIVWIKDNFPIEDIDIKLKNHSRSFAENVIRGDHSDNWVFQIAKYDIGDFHNWHVDDHLDRSSGFRKFVTIVQLSSSNEYEGGQLEIRDSGFVSPEQGSSISFLTIRQHRVLPITKGTRYSLVIWLFGPPWR